MKEKIKKASDKVQKHPLINAIIIMGCYFEMDSRMLNTNSNIAKETNLICLGIALTLFFVGYVSQYLTGNSDGDTKDIPVWINHKQRYSFLAFLTLAIFSITVALFCDKTILQWFPNLNNLYYESQVVILITLTPMMEELVFRYLLYDKWARIKFGTIGGILFSSLVFAACHPVTNLHSLVLYWAPALCLYLVYNSFGIYGSMFAHMLFNFIAL